MRIDEFIEASNRASSVDELFALYKQAMAALGFDRLIFSLMTDHIHINRNAKHGIMLNYPEDWMKQYVEQQYEVFDPVRCKMYSSGGAFVWDKLLDMPTLTKSQFDFMKQAEDAGLHDGVGVPLRGPRGAIAGVGAASSSGGVDLHKNVMSYVNLLSHQFYTVFLSLEKSADAPDDAILLSNREQEILKWCAHGKTKSEIGDIIKISEHTVDYHLRKIFQKMGVNNVNLAVLKALHMGLIQL